jgi:hypothetical protein
MDDHDHDNNHSSQQQQPHAPTSFAQDTPPRADVDEILRRKRKAREYKVSLRARLDTGILEREGDARDRSSGGEKKATPDCQTVLQNPAH